MVIIEKQNHEILTSVIIFFFFAYFILQQSGRVHHSNFRANSMANTGATYVCEVTHFGSNKSNDSLGETGLYSTSDHRTIRQNSESWKPIRMSINSFFPHTILDWNELSCSWCHKCWKLQSRYFKCHLIHL